MFAHQPLWLILVAGVAGLAACGIPIAMRNREVRAALFSLKALFSWKVFMITTIDVFALIMFIPLTRRMWRCSLRFEITPKLLIVTHQFTKARHEIPWASIATVSKVPPVPLSKGSPRQFSRIVLSDGTELLFAPHLSRCRTFVDELRSRFTGQVFDPYPPWGSSWDAV